MSCQLIGLARLGRDAELRYTNAGEPVANLSLAFNWGRKGEDGKRPTTWVEAALWGKLAEAIAQYLLKGTSAFVVLDDVHIETFHRRDGGDGHKLVGRVSTIEMAGAATQAHPQQTTKPAGNPKPQTGTRFDDMDDDIPF